MKAKSRPNVWTIFYPFKPRKWHQPLCGTTVMLTIDHYPASVFEHNYGMTRHSGLKPKLSNESVMLYLREERYTCRAHPQGDRHAENIDELQIIILILFY